MGQTHTPPARPHLSLVPTEGGLGAPTRTPHAEPATGRLVAAEVAVLLAGVTEEVLAAGPLTLPLALSVCMERHGVDAAGLVDSLRLLRGAILHVADLDPSEELIPLAAGDPKAAALVYAYYLLDLLDRAVDVTGAPPHTVAMAAAGRLV